MPFCISHYLPPTYMYIEMNGNANYNRVFIRAVVRFENPGGGEGHCVLNGVLRGHFLGIKI